MYNTKKVKPLFIDVHFLFSVSLSFDTIPNHFDIYIEMRYRYRNKSMRRLSLLPPFPTDIKINLRCCRYTQEERNAPADFPPSHRVSESSKHKFTFQHPLLFVSIFSREWSSSIKQTTTSVKWRAMTSVMMSRLVKNRPFGECEWFVK